MGVTGKVTVVMSEEPEGEEPAGESLKGLSRSIRAVLVPETGIPRKRRCCLSSDTYGNKIAKSLRCSFGISVKCYFRTLTFKSSRLGGRGPGLTGEMLLWLGYTLLTGEEVLLLA